LEFHHLGDGFEGEQQWDFEALGAHQFEDDVPIEVFALDDAGDVDVSQQVAEAIAVDVNQEVDE